MACLSIGTGGTTGTPLKGDVRLVPLSSPFLPVSGTRDKSANVPPCPGVPVGEGGESKKILSHIEPSPSPAASIYEDCIVRLHSHCIAGIPSWLQIQHASTVEALLVRHGSVLAGLGWTPDDVFASPVVFSRGGEAPAFNHRRAGLGWHVKPGDSLASITSQSVTVVAPDGSSFLFARPAHGAQ